MTWKDIKLTTLQKMFAAEGSAIPNDESVKDYIAGMPAAANEALQMICTAGKHISKKIEIAHHPSVNVLGEYGKHIHEFMDGRIEFEAEGAHAYYFEFYGDGILTITVGESEVINMPVASRQMYSEFRGTLENPRNEKVIITLTSPYKGNVKNASLYTDMFWDEEDIRPATERVPYDMDKLVQDFFSFDPQNIYYEGDLLTESYIRTSKMFDESGRVILFPANMPGNYTIYYRAYPDVISNVTPDDYELNVAPEIAVILPLYMASQLYKDDDNGVATAYRNEFEVAFERLQLPAKLASSEKFVNKSGWI